MVSRLISSLTNLLQPPDAETSEENRRVVEKALKKAAASSPDTPEHSIGQDTEGPEVSTIHKNSRNPEGRFLISAETLDNAIVNQLQSPHSVESGKNEVHLTSENSDGDQEAGVFSYRDAYINARAMKETPIPDTHITSPLQGPRKFLSTAESVPIYSHPNKENLTEDMHTDEEEFAEQISDSSNMNPEPRSIVFKNRQFILENSSREALCSDSHKTLEDADMGMDEMDVPLVNPTLFRSQSRHQQGQFGTSRESMRGGNEFKGTRRHSRSRSPAPGISIGFSPSFTSSLGEHLFESTMNEIIESGGEDFKKKYASWVWEAFRAHLVKMKGILLSEFNQKMQEALEEREQEVSELQKQYRGKLTEFEKTTEGFQQMIDTLYQENQRAVHAKDFLIDKLKQEFLQCKKHFEQDLLRQMQSYRKEAEVEKLELQKRNDELMMIMLTDASKGGLQDSFRREIDSLHKMIRALTSQNEVLHQQLDEVSNSTTSLERTTMEAFQVQLNQTKEEMLELSRRLQLAEREKEDIAIAHHQEIAKLNRKMQESNTRYDHQLRGTVVEMEALRKRYLKETKNLKQKLSIQESQHDLILHNMKDQYGGQVRELSKAVSKLQAELTTTGNTLNGKRKA